MKGLLGSWLLLAIYTSTFVTGQYLSESALSHHNINNNRPKLEEKNVILFIGNSKSGVSTMVQILTSDNKNLQTTTNKDGVIVITDTNGYIGQTMYSHTVRSNYISLHDNIVYVDLPGINTELTDPALSHSQYINILTSYEIQQVVGTSRLVKIVLVLDKSLISSTYDTIIQYLINVKKVLTNTSVYKDGICTIVNNVDDQLHTTTITNYLRSMNEYVNQSLRIDFNDKQFINNITDIIVNKMSVMSRAVVSDITLDQDQQIQQHKQNIENMLSSFSFVNKMSHKVGCPISQYTNNTLLIDTMKYINHNVSQLISQFKHYTQLNYQTKIDQITDVELFINNTKTDVEVLRGFCESILETETLNSFMIQAQRVTKTLDIPVPPTVYEQLMELNTLVEAISNLTGTLGEVNSKDWNKQADYMKSVAEEVLLWYEFLVDLYDAFSDYQVQTNKELYNVKYLSDWGQPGMEQGLVISEDNFKQFLDIVITDFFDFNDDYQKLRNQNPDYVKITDLNSIIYRSIQSTIGTIIDDRVLHLYGDSVVLSETTSIITNNPNISVINIVALKSVVLDMDLLFDPNQHLSILAQDWISNNNKVISSEGQHGEDLGQASLGYNGQPGFPGGTTGNFYGIGTRSRSLQLSVYTTGGKGGKGEDGGEGEVGLDFQTDPSTSSRCKYDFDYYGAAIYYPESSCGENGKNGGVGGYGGYGGNISLVWIFDQQVGFNHKIQNGLVGEKGIGGPAGKGGATDRYIESMCFVSTACRYNNARHFYYVRPFNFIHGEDGTVTDGIASPSSVEPNYIFLNSVNFYKEYLANATRDKFNSANIRRILANIDKPDKVNFYQLIDYFAEYKLLNKKYAEAIYRQESLFFYQVFERKIVYNMDQLINDNNDNRKAVAQLLTAVKTRIASMLKQDGGLIIDIETYLQLALQTVYDLEKYIDEKNDEKIKDQQVALRDEFKAQIQQKIKQASELINNTLRPKLQEKYKEISDSVDALIDETNALIEQGEQVLEELEATRRRLKRALKLQAFFGVLSFGVGIALDYLGVAGPISDAITGAISIPNDSVLGDGSQLPDLNVPDGVFALPKMIYENWLKRRNSTADFLVFMYEDLLTYLDPDHELLKLIDNVKNDIYANKGTLSIQDMLKPIAATIQAMIDSGTSRIGTDVLTTSLANVAVAGMPDLIQTLNNEQQVGKVNKNDLKIVDNAIAETKDEIRSLQLYLGQIEYIFIPMLINMKTDVEDFLDHLNTNQTGAQLEVAKWGVQSAFKDFTRVVSSFTEGFNVQDDFERELEDINDILITIINVYDRIEQLQEQDNLAGYIANIVSPNADMIQITDPVLRAAVEEMQLDMKLSIVMTHYTEAVSAFKQWVLPFAEPYMYDLNFNMTGDTQELVAEVERRLVQLQSKLMDYYSRVDEYDQYISVGQFDSNSKAGEPFMVWTNNKFQSNINDLFNGKELMMSSVVGLNNFHSKNAIKFNIIKLNIKLIEENSTLAVELKDILEYFDVEITHLGNNYYNFDGKTYFVSNEQLFISYSFETDNFGQPLRYNVVYDKILRGDLMLSPFSMWKIRLMIDGSKKETVFADFSFDELDRFKKLVNLELIGLGSYIRPVNGQLPLLNMDQYYTEI